jgi:anaerobic selenocysteine-containing dehydrogenase
MVNPVDAQNLGVYDGDLVVVENDFGRQKGIVNTSETFKPGVIGIAHGWGDPADKRGISEKGSNAQRLIPDDVRYDPVTGLALMTAVPVNVTTRPKAARKSGVVISEIVQT